MLAITHIPQVLSWDSIRTKLLASLITRDARHSLTKFFKKEIPVFGSVGWLPTAFLDGESKAEEIFHREVEAWADTFQEFIESRYETDGALARMIFLELATHQWEDDISDVLYTRGQKHTKKLRDLLF